MAIAADPTGLDPQVGPGGSDHVVLYPMFDTLIDFDASLTPVPGLATSWEYVTPTSLRLELAEGVTFHDGTPMDAEAVKASLERFKEIGAHADLANVTGVTTDGESAVVLELAQPDSSLLLVLADRAGMVVSPTAAADRDAFAQHPIGTGPFRFVEYRTGDVVRMEANPDYWRDGPSLDAIDMRIIPERRAAANALISGEIDFSDGLDPTDIQQLEGEEDLTVRADVGMWFDMIYLNLSQPPLDDARVRRAVNHAINREDLIEAVANGIGQPAWLPVPEQHWAYDESAVPTWEHDVEEARRLMEEAGYGDGATITVVTNTTAIDQRRNEVIQAQLAAIGIDYQINPTDLNQGIQQYFEAQAFNAAQYAWSGRPDPGQTYYRLFAQESYQNPGNVELPGLEDLLQQAVATDDLDERAAAYAEANEIITEEAPYVPLYFRQNVTAYTDRLQDYEPNLLGKPKVAFVSLSD